MKAFLMHRDQDFFLPREPLPNEAALTQDLELTTLFDAMAGGDGFLFEVARTAVLSSLTDPEAIRYRQQVLADCLEQPSVVIDLYNLAVEAIGAQKRIWRSFLSSPDSVLNWSVQLLELFVSALRRLRGLADEHAGSFRSEGFNRFFAMLASELDDQYLATVEGHLKELKFRRGVLISAALGKGNKGIRYVLRRAPEQKGWMQRLSVANRSGLSFQIADRDENGFRALSELRGRGINSRPVMAKTCTAASSARRSTPCRRRARTGGHDVVSHTWPAKRQRYVAPRGRGAAAPGGPALRAGGASVGPGRFRRVGPRGTMRRPRCGPRPTPARRASRRNGPPATAPAPPRRYPPTGWVPAGTVRRWRA